MYKHLSKEALLELLQERDESLLLQTQHYEAAIHNKQLSIASFKPILEENQIIDFQLTFSNQAFQNLLGDIDYKAAKASDLPAFFKKCWVELLLSALEKDNIFVQKLSDKSKKNYEAVFHNNEHQVSLRFKRVEEILFSEQEVLIANEERYKLIAEVTTDFMYEVKIEADNTPVGVGWLSGAVERVTGYTLEEIMNFPGGFAQIIHPEDSKKVTIKVQRDIKHIRSNKYKYRIRTKKGRTKWLEDKVLVRKKDGKMRILGAVRDITNEQKIEQALHIERERYSTLFQTSRRGILIVDMKNRRAIDSNPRVEQLFGVSKKELSLGNTLRFSPEFQPDGRRSFDVISPLFKTHIEKKIPIFFEWTFLRPDGKEFIAEVLFRSIKLNNKDLSVMFIDDITDRKRAQTARQLSEERFELLSDSMDAAFCLSTEDEVLHANKAIEKIWERSRDEILTPKKFLKTLHVDDRRRVTKAISRLFQEDVDIQYRILMPDGNIKWIWSKTFRINKADSKGLVAVLSSEITQMKNNEAALIKATEDALESARLKSAFIASMSHEIRTPMNGIIGFTEMLVDPKIPSADKEQFPFIINNNCQRLLTVLNDILAISKIEAQEVQVRIGVVNVYKLLKELHQLFQLNTEQNNVGFLLDISLKKEERYIRTDETKIRQILTNLLSNAVKFTEKGQVILKCFIKANRLIFLVKDSGIGISYKQQDKIFNRFHQAEEVSPSKYGGTGLGLSISDGLTKLLEGYILVSSTLGLGTSFCLNLPYKPAHRIKIKEQAKPQRKTIDLQQKTILVAEDERFNFMLLQKALTLANAKVIHAETGQEAIDLLQIHPEIELILMDMRMPELDGMEAIRIIKADPKLKDIPIITQTAFGLDEDRERILAAGSDAYIAKPIKRNDLYDLLNQFLIV